MSGCEGGRRRERRGRGSVFLLSAIDRKVRAAVGESLAETMAALLVACMGMVMLPGAVVASARATAAVKAQEMVPETGESAKVTEAGTVCVTVTGGGISGYVMSDLQVTRYGSEESGFYRYEVPAAGDAGNDG